MHLPAFLRVPKEKMRRQFPQFARERMRLPRKGSICVSFSAFTGSLFFFIRPVLTQSFYFPRGLNVDICLAGSERLDEKYSDRCIIYRMCNLNNPRSLGYRAIRIALPSVIARSAFFTNCKNMNNARGRFLRDKLFLQDRQRFGIKNSIYHYCFKYQLGLIYDLSGDELLPACYIINSHFSMLTIYLSV